MGKSFQFALWEAAMIKTESMLRFLHAPMPPFLVFNQEMKMVSWKFKNVFRQYLAVLSMFHCCLDTIAAVIGHRQGTGEDTLPVHAQVTTL